jgi:hypothetical protein
MLCCKNNLKCGIFFIEEKQFFLVQGEATFVDTKVDYLKMEDVIIDVKCEILIFQVE